MALLAYLAATRQPHSRDLLAALFWPELDQTGARNYLRHDLFELKNVIGEHNLLIEREQVGLHPGAGLWVDVSEFRAQVQKARQHRHLPAGAAARPLDAECQVALENAVTLSTAGFMAGFSLPDNRDFEEWQFSQSEELRQSLAQALDLLVQWHTGRGEFEPAISYARRQLSLDPLDEPAHRQLMRLYAWAGQQSAALRQYHECLRLLRDELGIEPEQETRKLYEMIRKRQLAAPAGLPKAAASVGEAPGSSAGEAPGSRAGEAPGSSAGEASLAQPGPVGHNLPSLRVPLIGRENELERIAALLRDEAQCRLLTLVGPGGIGKTSLATEAATRLAEDPACPFCDGIYYVPLAAFSQAEAIIPAIAESLNMPLQPDPDRRAQQLFDYLQPKRVLLLLDNFEQLVSDQTVRLLVDLLSHAPQVKLMLTSRERLNAHFEQVLTLRGLDVPPAAGLESQPVEKIMAEFAAIRLFAHRAARLKPDFTLTTANLPVVVQICQMLEGLPLGIELAATWLQVLTPAEIASEINRSLDFLTAQWPDTPERHHSLRAVFESSWEMLAEPERSALMCLALFPGSFSRPAAQAVANTSVHTLLALVNKSWLQYQEDGRYQIHALLRQYAAEKLNAMPADWQQAMERYSAYFAAFLEEQAEVMKGRRQKEAHQAIAGEFENIRLAWRWLLEKGQLRLVVDRMLLALFRYTRACAMPFELDQLLVQAFQALAKQAGHVGDGGAADPYIEAVLSTARVAGQQIGTPGIYFFDNVFLAQDKTLLQAWRLAGNLETLKTMGYWGILLPVLYGAYIDPHTATRCLRQLLTYFRQQNRPWELANTLYLLVNFLFPHLHQEDANANSEEARQFLLEALAIFEELGDQSSSAYVLFYLGELNFSQEKYPEAIERWRIAQASLQEVGEWVAATNIFTDIGHAYQVLGNFEAAFQNYHLRYQVYIDKGDKGRAALALVEESLVASRHSTLEHARQVRQQSLTLLQEAGFTSAAAWSIWEIGEINRLAGDMAGAREWYDKARPLLETLHPTGLVFYYRGLGDLAQAAGDIAEAKKLFQESLQRARETEHEWAQVYALCGLGRAETASGEVEAAREHLKQGLEIARRLNQEDMLLLCLAGLAAVCAAAGDLDQAVELVALVTHHKQSWNETKAQAAALLQSITSLPPERLAAAQAAGRSLTIEEAIRRVGP